MGSVGLSSPFHACLFPQLFQPNILPTINLLRKQRCHQTVMNKGLSKCELPFPSEVCDFLVRDSEQVLCAIEIYVVSSLFPFHTVHTGQRKQIKIIQSGAAFSEGHLPRASLFKSNQEKLSWTSQSLPRSSTKTDCVTVNDFRLTRRRMPGWRDGSAS